MQTNQRRLETGARLTLTETILELSGDGLHVAHAAGAGGLATLLLGTPLVCDVLEIYKHNE